MRRISYGLAHFLSQFYKIITLLIAAHHGRRLIIIRPVFRPVSMRPNSPWFRLRESLASPSIIFGDELDAGQFQGTMQRFNGSFL
jgi:hypothetical protein